MLFEQFAPSSSTELVRLVELRARVLWSISAVALTLWSCIYGL
ncbi:MAG: hypothetical protein R3A51_00415 [Nannocystaceae bacterium]